MPPRKQQTQEEKARQRQEEQERRALEEEEQRVREEQQQQQQQDRDRVEKEERDKELQEEGARFLVERAELSQFLAKREQSHSSTLEELRSRYQWERYTKCPVTPDSFSLRDINTYLTLWREEPPPNSFEALEQKLAEVSLFMKELASLQDLGLAPAPQKSGVDFDSVLEQIQSILAQRLDSATLQLLRQPAGFIDEVYGNLKTEARLSSSSDAALSVSLWGNVAINHRMTHVEFSERELGVEASQRGLLVPNVALRVIHTTRDLFSPRARSHAPRPVVPFLDEEPSQSDLAAKQERGNASTSGESSNKGSAVNVSCEDPTRSKPQSASSNREATKKEQEESPAEPSKEEATVSETAGLEHQQPEGAEQFSLEACEIDLRQFSPLGPISIMEYIRLPPQPRVMGGWHMQELEPDVIKQLSYPILLAGQDITEIAPGTKLWPFVSVSMNIPGHLVLAEEPKLARWDEGRCQWRTDGFTEVNVDQENRILTFKSNCFSPIALMQDHYLNMPYQGWTVQPMQHNTIKLSITGNLHQFEILVERDKCRLVKPDIPELTGLLNKPLLVKRFIQALKSHGLNLAPESDAPNYVAISNKDSDIENEVYRDLSLMAGHKFNFTWSSWNASCHGDQFILRVCEHQGESLPDVNDWDLVLVGPKCYKLGMRELSEEFSIEKCAGCKTHSSLYHVLLADSPVKWNVPADMEAHMAHTEAIRTLLMAIRPLVFA